jgi:hypothetical protein
MKTTSAQLEGRPADETSPSTAWIFRMVCPGAKAAAAENSLVRDAWVRQAARLAAPIVLDTRESGKCFNLSRAFWNRFPSPFPLSRIEDLLPWEMAAELQPHS